MSHKVAYWCLPSRGHKGALLTRMHREKSMSGTAGKQASTGQGEASVEVKPAKVPPPELLLTLVIL